MKKILYICACAILTGLGIFIASCTKDPYVESTASQSQDVFLTVEEAQSFFEDSFAELQTRSGDKKKRFLDPGEYTPQWKDAQTSQNEGVGSVDIPILPEYKYRAIRSEFKNGKAKAYVVELSQKLVVVKNKKTKGKAQYVLTLIPDKEYYEKNKNRSIVKRFLNSGDKDNFSGYALYLYHGIPVQLSKYKDGVKRRGASIIGINDKDLRIRNIKLITQELSAFKFQFHMATPLTRTGGENDGFYGCPNCQSMPCQCLDDVDVECCSICGSTGGCMCYIYDMVCPFCNSYPCSCKQSLSCPECGSQGCNGECQTRNGCDYCGNLWCIGDCQRQGCGGCGHCDECNPPCDCGQCYDCTGYQCGKCGKCKECSPEKFTCPNGCDKMGCKGECIPKTIMCEYGQCDLTAGGSCSCCTTCQGSCEAKCKNGGKCHVKNGCECTPKPTECVCVSGTPGQGIAGGLYGAARNGGRTHNGVDIGVNIGDPIRAIYSGVVRKLVTEQPNRVKNDYPPGYNGDRNAAGNRIRIHTNNTDGNFEVSYMHLNQGNTLNLSVGQQVEAGDIIGYGGISGNSYPNSPVLHIQMNNGTDYSDHFDPATKLPYINTTGEPCGAENCINK